MGTREVTQAQWESVMGSNPSHFCGEDLPVERVSWTECAEFCRKAGLRLPTEAEWEYACRAGSETAFSWGNALDGTQANCNGKFPYGTATPGPSRKATTPAGLYGANAWGLLDMHGNVWEWCEDRYGEYPAGAQTDPPAATDGWENVCRGGSWDYDAQYSRSARRQKFHAGNRYPNVGFRACQSEGGGE
jgi:formylglycine-generating enzyme required for sulfatase activity